MLTMLAPIGVWAENYDLWIGETQVTDANALNVLGDQETPTVVFDATTNTLTLNGATLTAPIKIGLSNLTIDIQGTNTIETTECCIQKIDNTTPSVTFLSTGDEVGSLALKCNGSSGVYGVGYGSFTISDQFAVILKYYDRYYSNTYYFTDGSTTEAMLTPSYGITVGGMQIGKGNADNVTGDGIGDGSVEVGEMVSFDKTTNTLTLNGAEINGKITYNGTSNLTIAFSGTNSVTTSESSAIQYKGSESDRPKLTFSSTNGTLTINGESIEGFSDVDFGSLNLASISAQGVYYDTDGFLMRGRDTTPSDLTITTETYYPIWIYDPSLSNTSRSHTQLRGESTITIGDGSVSFNGNDTITISNINFNYEGNTLIVVGPSMTELTVNLVGQSTATSGCTVLSLWDTTPLTFTTDASTPGSITGYDIVLWNNFGNGQISYENGLGLFYDAENSNKETISTTGTYIKIGDTSFSETGNVTFGEGTAHFDASSNTLTLTGATIGGATAGANIQVLVDDLTIEISGTNTIYGNITYNGSNYQSSNIQINKASNAESASLKVTNVEGFTSCTWGDGLYLSAHDGQGATIDVHYEHFDGEGGTMQSYYGGEIADVTFSTTSSNAIWVAGNMVTETGNVEGTGISSDPGSVYYDATDKILTLNGASIYTNEEDPSPLIVCNGDLTVNLEGENQIQYNRGSTYVFKNNGTTGALTIKGEGSLGITSECYTGMYKGLCDGFSTVTFNDNLGLFNRSGTKSIENITGEAPVFDINNAPSGYCYLQANNGLLLNATYHYKITYVDSSIEGHDVEVDLPLDETTYNISNVTLSISDLAGPCTITAYAKLNGNTIGSNKAKLFGSNPSPFRLVYGADPVDLVLAPAIEEDDGISINGIEANVTYNEETGKISSEALGSFGGPVGMSEDGQTTILNNYFTMNFEVVPPAPTVSPESGTYLTTDNDPITITGTGQDNTTVKYKWDDGDAMLYEEAIPVQSGTLKAWEEYTEGSTTLTSDTTMVEYTVKTDIEALYVAPIEDLYYTGSAVTPTIVVKETEGAEASLTAGTDYTVSYKQGETAIDAADLINVATYTAVISGQGSYGGTKEVTFNIIKATPTITFAQESYSATLGETFTSPATVDDWTVTPTASSNMSVATISEGQITLVGVGTTTITVTYAGDDNYNSTSASYQLVVSRALDIAFVGSNLWATYYATEDLTVPEGLKAYAVSGVNETTGVVSVEAIDYIPANKAILLQREANGAANGYTATAYTGQTTVITSMLQGTSQAASIEDMLGATVYVLYNDAFVKATSGTIPANRAYLVLGAMTTPNGNAPQMLTLDGGTTGIHSIENEELTIDNIYDLSGRKLSGKPSKSGLYIKNGKKVVVNK